MKRRVLIINRGIGSYFGGGENFDIRVSQSFLNLGFDVTILTGRGINRDSLTEDYPEIEFKFVKSPYFRKINIPFWVPGIIKRAFNFITLELDLLIFEFHALYYVITNQRPSLIIAGAMVRLGTVLSLVSLSVINRLPGPVSPWIWVVNMNWIYRFGRNIIVANGDSYQKSKWIRRIKFLDIGYPQAHQFDNLHEQENRDIDVLWVGRLEVIKGADRLVGVIQSLHRYNDSLNITIAGGGSMLPMICKEFASSANISVLGEISSSSVQELFSRSKRLLMLSRYDNWPNVVFEALAQGCNVYAPPVGGIPTIASRFIGVNLIQDPDNGVFVAEFVTSVDLVEPKKVIERYSEVARTWDQVATEILNICGVKSGTRDAPIATVERT